LDGGSVVKCGGVGDSGDNRGEGGVDEVLEGVGGVEEVLKLETGFVVDEVWSAGTLNVLSHVEGMGGSCLVLCELFARVLV
jgi:hypothetical protein